MVLPASRSRQRCSRLELRGACRRPFRLSRSSRRSPCGPEPLVGHRPHAARVGELPQLPWTRRVPTWLGHCAGSVRGGWATANATAEMAPGEPAGRRSGPERSCNTIHLRCAHPEETSSGERQRHILPRAPACAIASGPRLERNATVPFLSRSAHGLLARGLPVPCSRSAAGTTRRRGDGAVNGAPAGADGFARNRVLGGQRRPVDRRRTDEWSVFTRKWSGSTSLTTASSCRL
jgi:hypothetical protein